LLSKILFVPLPLQVICIAFNTAATTATLNANFYGHNGLTGHFLMITMFSVETFRKRWSSTSIFIRPNLLMCRTVSVV